MPDKFLIPVIDEQLDELFGVVLFSRIVLKSRYHQIWMRPMDFPKMIFMTHEGHYKFLVVSLGLTNARVTFQSPMNRVFQPYLSRFVSVIFDDFLIYSRAEEEHSEHFWVGVIHFVKPPLICLFEEVLIRLAQSGVFGAHGITGRRSSLLELNRGHTEMTNAQELEGVERFLGLTCYYRKFVHGYSSTT